MEGIAEASNAARQEVVQPDVRLVSQFPSRHYKLAWRWLNETPSANFDDFGPQTFDKFKEEMIVRQHVERVTEVLADGVPIGIIGFRPISPTTGFFHGICFAASAHHTGIPQTAVSMFLDQLWADGIVKVSAAILAHNHRIYNFLVNSFDFEEEGYLRAHTSQNGKPVSMRLLAKFAPTDTANLPSSQQKTAS